MGRSYYYLPGKHCPLCCHPTWELDDDQYEKANRFIRERFCTENPKKYGMFDPKNPHNQLEYAKNFPEGSTLPYRGHYTPLSEEIHKKGLYDPFRGRPEATSSKTSDNTSQSKDSDKPTSSESSNTNPSKASDKPSSSETSQDPNSSRPSDNTRSKKPDLTDQNASDKTGNSDSDDFMDID